MILVAATPEKMHERPALAHPGRQMLGQHQRAEHLDVERQPERVPVQVGDPAPGPGGGGRDHLVDRAEPLAEGGDGLLVGQVDGLGADPGFPGVRARELLLVTARGDDVSAGVTGGEGNRAGDPAPPSDDEHFLIMQ